MSQPAHEPASYYCNLDSFMVADPDTESFALPVCER